MFQYLDIFLNLDGWICSGKLVYSFRIYLNFQKSLKFVEIEYIRYRRIRTQQFEVQKKCLSNAKITRLVLDSGQKKSRVQCFKIIIFKQLPLVIFVPIMVERIMQHQFNVKK